MKKFNLLSLLIKSNSAELDSYIKEVAEQNSISAKNLLHIVSRRDLAKAFLGTKEGVREAIVQAINGKNEVSFDFQGVSVHIANTSKGSQYTVVYAGEEYKRDFKNINLLQDKLATSLNNITKSYIYNPDLQKVSMKIMEKEANDIVSEIGPPNSSDAYTHKLRRMLNLDSIGGKQTIQSKLFEIAQTMKENILSGESFADALAECKKEIKNNEIATLSNHLTVIDRRSGGEREYRGEPQDFEKNDYILKQSFVDRNNNPQMYFFRLQQDDRLKFLSNLEKNDITYDNGVQTFEKTTLKNAKVKQESIKGLIAEQKNINETLKSEYLLVRNEDRKIVKELGAKFDSGSGLFYITKDQDKKVFAKYLKENNPNPIYKGMEENITTEDYRQAVLGFLAERGLHIGPNEFYEEDSSKWIKLYRDGSRNSKGGIKIKHNTCEATNAIETYQNVLLFQDWQDGGKKPEAISTNQLFNDSSFISQQMKIAKYGNSIDYNTLTHEEKEMASLWDRTRKATSNLYLQKKENQQKIEALLYAKGEAEVVRRFSAASKDIKKILQHPYVVKKNLPKEYLGNFKVSGSTLLIPLIRGGIKKEGEKARLINLQRIYKPKDSKDIVKQYGINVSKSDKELGIERYNTSSKGVYFIASASSTPRTIKDLNTSQPIILVEGVGTGIFLAKALHEQNVSAEVVSAMSIGGIKSLLDDIKKEDSSLLSRVVISADNDEHKIYKNDKIIEKENVGKTNSIAYCKEYDVSMVLPDFSFLPKEKLLEKKPSDWEDLYKMRGSKEVVHQINKELGEIHKRNNSIIPFQKNEVVIHSEESISPKILNNA